MKRSSHEWVVIAVTIALAIYFGVQVAEALLILARAGATSAYSAYIPAGIIIAVFLVAAWSVYRRYRWSLFIYQLGIVLSGVQLVLLFPGLWQVTEMLAKSPDWANPLYRQMLWTMLMPIFQFALALYSAIVIYTKIYSAPPLGTAAAGGG